MMEEEQAAWASLIRAVGWFIDWGPHPDFVRPALTKVERLLILDQAPRSDLQQAIKELSEVCSGEFYVRLPDRLRTAVARMDGSRARLEAAQTSEFLRGLEG